VAFRSDVPVLDDLAVLGRPHDTAVTGATADDLVQTLDRYGICGAVVHHPYAVHFDHRAGNALVLDEIGAWRDRLFPRFVVDFSAEPDIGAFAQTVRDAAVRSLIAFPKTHTYPFAPWVVDAGFDWLASTGAGLWVPIDEVDANDLHAVLVRHPRVPVVLTGVHYSHYPLLGPLGRALGNLHLDLARFDVGGGVVKLLDVYGPRRLLFGSGWPQFDPGPYLYYLHRAVPDEATRRAITHDNLARLLRLDDGGA